MNFFFCDCNKNRSLVFFDNDNDSVNDYNESNDISSTNGSDDNKVNNGSSDAVIRKLIIIMMAIWMCYMINVMVIIIITMAIMIIANNLIT